MDVSRYVSPQPARSTILASLLLAAFAINLDTTIVNVALPTLVRELHASNSQLQWIVDAYNLVFAALLLASGSLSDRVGRKGMLLAGLGVFGLASAAGGLTTTPGQLIVARSEEHTSELQSQSNLVCRLLLEKKKNIYSMPLR